MEKFLSSFTAKIAKGGREGRDEVLLSGVWLERVFRCYRACPSQLFPHSLRCGLHSFAATRLGFYATAEAVPGTNLTAVASGSLYCFGTFEEILTSFFASRDT